MSERVDLASFIPEEKRGIEIELEEGLTSVIGRISQVLPPDKVWEFFSSTPNETGGRIVFPYCRVDNAVFVCRNWIWMINNYKPAPDKSKEYYGNACLLALRALLWVEVGFQGLENLAISPASRNWTSTVGYFVNDEERAKGIMTRGADLYKECLKGFVDFRTQQGITRDDFSEYRVEYLLDNFRVAE